MPKKRGIFARSRRLTKPKGYWKDSKSTQEVSEDQGPILSFSNDGPCVSISNVPPTSPLIKDLMKHVNHVKYEERRSADFTMVYQYTKLNGPLEDGHKYNVFGVVKEIIKKPYQVNGKYISKISIMDETIPKPFLITIFCRTVDEVIPEISEGSVIRLHRMVIETFNKGFDGRVFSSKDVAIILKEKQPTLDWTTSAKTLSISDSDNSRAKELITWRETLADVHGELFEMGVNCGSMQNTSRLPSIPRAASDNSTQIPLTFLPVERSEKRKRDSDTETDDEGSRERRLEEKVLDFAPCAADLEQADYKDLLVWECKCGGQYRTSQLNWSPVPKKRKNLGSTKCRGCGTLGMAIPRFHFYINVSEGADGQPQRSLISGQFGCQFLGTSVLSYAFDDDESTRVHTQLISKL